MDYNCHCFFLLNDPFLTTYQHYQHHITSCTYLIPLFVLSRLIPNAVHTYIPLVSVTDNIVLLIWPPL